MTMDEIGQRRRAERDRRRARELLDECAEDLAVEMTDDGLARARVRIDGADDAALALGLVANRDAVHDFLEHVAGGSSVHALAAREVLRERSG